MYEKILAATALMIGMALSLPAFGQDSVCATRDKIISHLSSSYAEAPVAMGLASNGGVIEILRSRDSATWTIVITMPDGVTCLLAAGKNWESVPLIPAGQRS